LSLASRSRPSNSLSVLPRLVRSPLMVTGPPIMWTLSMAAARAKAEMLLAPDSKQDRTRASCSSGEVRKVTTFDFLFSTDILPLWCRFGCRPRIETDIRVLVPLCFISFGDAPAPLAMWHQLAGSKVLLFRTNCQYQFAAIENYSDY